MVASILGFVVKPAIDSVLNSFLDAFSLPESGGLIVIGSLLISGAMLLRLWRSTGRKRAR